jgi:hypothetical protein
MIGAPKMPSRFSPGSLVRTIWAGETTYEVVDVYWHTASGEYLYTLKGADKPMYREEELRSGRPDVPANAVDPLARALEISAAIGELDALIDHAKVAYGNAGIIQAQFYDTQLFDQASARRESLRRELVALGKGL